MATNLKEKDFVFETEYTKVFITKNDFLHNGIVKYEDANGNKIMIICNRTGQGFSLKCRPKEDGLKVNVIDFAFPFQDVSGANFSIKTDRLNQEELAEAIQKNTYVFEEAIQIAERWIQICYSLVSYFSDTSLLSNLAYRKSVKTNPELTMQPQDIEEGFLMKIVDELRAFKEMEEFVSLVEVTEDPKVNVKNYVPQQ